MLTAVIAIQQVKARSIGLPPDLTSFTIFVFSPIAPIAITIKNLLSCFKNPKILFAVDYPSALFASNAVTIVVMTDASTK